MKHPYINSNPSGFDSDCSQCGGKARDSVHNLGLPPDVAVYLINAAIDTVKEQSFTPSNQDELRVWLEGNVREIGSRALEAMGRLRDKLSSPEIMAQAQQALAISVYSCIRRENTKAAWNPRYAAYAKAHGLTPDEMLKHDGGSMVNFLCWGGS